MTSTLVCYFDNYDDAKEAEQDLEASGFSEGEVTLIHEEAETFSAASPRQRTFWEKFKNALGFASPEDRAYYEEASRRGTLLTVRTSDDRIDEATRIIERHNPLNIDERAAQWRAAGWTGGFVPEVAAQAEGRYSSSSLSTSQTMSEGSLERETTIPVVEERLRVGVRPIMRGAVRIHSHVTEVPVEEEVVLRREETHTERRSVDRPIAATDEAFRERTISVTEMGEEAVVAKEARVVEEISVSKEVIEEREKVRDTVRRTEVEIERSDEDEDIEDDRKYQTDIRPHH